MTRDKLDAVMTEVRRFVTAAERLDAARRSDPTYEHRAESGAVRRASLDLTRSLAELRRL